MTLFIIIGYLVLALAISLCVMWTQRTMEIIGRVEDELLKSKDRELEFNRQLDIKEKEVANIIEASDTL